MDMQTLRNVSGILSTLALPNDRVIIIANSIHRSNLFAVHVHTENVAKKQEIYFYEKLIHCMWSLACSWISWKPKQKLQASELIGCGAHSGLLFTWHAYRTFFYTHLITEPSLMSSWIMHKQNYEFHMRFHEQEMQKKTIVAIKIVLWNLWTGTALPPYRIRSYPWSICICILLQAIWQDLQRIHERHWPYIRIAKHKFFRKMPPANRSMHDLSRSLVCCKDIAC